MSKRIHALAQQLTGKETLEECSLEELQHMARRHPYFAPAQFLLLQKLRQSGTAGETDAQYRKAVLFYHDPLLFEQFISSDRFYVDEIGLRQPPGTGSAEGWREEAAVPLQEIEEEKKQAAPAQEIDVEEEPEVTGDPIETIGIEEGEEESPAGDSPAGDDAATALPGKEEPGIQAAEQRTPEASLEKLAELYEAPAAGGEAAEAETDTDNGAQAAAPPLSSPEPAAQEPAGEALAFEPFHTVDYFASQGIRIADEGAPADKLGRQVMSFTEWLKTMKRLPAAQMGNSPESPAEKKVESLASHSVTDSNVVTEAMAEVWRKQGNTAKALDIYNKLSLLNPSKKAYFAAKIENLKQS